MKNFEVIKDKWYVLERIDEENAKIYYMKYYHTNAMGTIVSSKSIYFENSLEDSSPRIRNYNENLISDVLLEGGHPFKIRHVNYKDMQIIYECFPEEDFLSFFIKQAIESLERIEKTKQ